MYITVNNLINGSTYMFLIKLIDFLRTRMKSIIWFSYAILILLVIMDAMPFIVDKHHAHTNIEYIPGFWAIFGFFSCLTIIFASKWFGHSGIMQPEDYYTNTKENTND